KKMQLTREISFDSQAPYIDVRLFGTFLESKPSYMFISIRSQSLEGDDHEMDRKFIYRTDDGTENIQLSKLESIEQVSSPLRWIASLNRDFTVAIVNTGSLKPTGLVQPMGIKGNGQISVTYPLSTNKFEIPLRVYFGPKDLSLLRKVDPTLDETVDLGWFKVL